ncbi:MAG: MaoC family dehydratase [Neomegalonema sp.]|nr:MaoC family dehydratase [Neomegalonema sp.]
MTERLSDSLSDSLDWPAARDIPLPRPEPIALALMQQRISAAPWHSPWFAVPQARIEAFADVTEDRQFIHTDPARAAAEGPFGGPVAHGFLTLSLIAPMSQTAVPDLIGQRAGINLGFDKLRFLAPVPSGACVRGAFTLLDLKERKPGEITLTLAVRIELEDGRAALAARWLTRSLLG